MEVAKGGESQQVEVAAHRGWRGCGDTQGMRGSDGRSPRTWLVVI